MEISDTNSVKLKEDCTKVLKIFSAGHLTIEEEDQLIVMVGQMFEELLGSEWWLISKR